MVHKHNVLAICGSTKATSLNKSLLHAIADLTAADFNFTLYTDIDQIPHFNADLDQETPPPAVVHFRRLLQDAAGILICTPEYAMGVPGTLKNALDWIVSSSGFYHKPVALITASSHGHTGHAALLETLRILESTMTEETQLVIPFVRTKVGMDHKITDSETREKVLNVVNAFKKLIQAQSQKGGF